MKVQKYKRGQIWWYEYNGSGYDGSIIGKTRPVIIVSNDLANEFSECLIAIPCTTQAKKDMPTHLTTIINGVSSTLLAESLMAVNTSRLNDYIGVADSELMNKVDDILAIAVGLKDIPLKKNIDTTPAISDIIDETQSVAMDKDNSSINIVNIKRGRPAPSKEEMIRYLNDYGNHDIDYMMKKYNVPNKQAAALRASRYRKKIAEVS